MLLTIDELVKILRSSVNVQFTDAETIDSAYLSMTDEEIKLFIKLGCSGAFPDISDLSDLSSGSEYPIILLAKIELYSKLAVLKADKIDLVADNNNQLKQSQRFGYYQKLIAEARAEYENWIRKDGMGKVQSFDVLLANRHYSSRNYELTPTPKVKLNIDEVTNDSVSFSWSTTNVTHFGRYKVFFSTTPIVDMYKDGAKAEDKISSEATLLKSTSDIRNSTHRVKGLLPNTAYYVAVLSIERNLVFGYEEKSFTTLEAFVEEVEVSNEFISEKEV